MSVTNRKTFARFDITETLRQNSIIVHLIGWNMTEIKFASYEDRYWSIGNIGGYLHGNCYLFAMALHRFLGLPLVGIVDETRIIHAGVLVDENTIRDARGDISRDEFTKEFGTNPSSIRSIKDSDLISLLIERYCDMSTVDRHIMDARNVAESIWPDWNWREPKVEKFRAFADDLEAISRKHGIWLYEVTPTVTSVVAFGYGDEKGYLLEQSPSANSPKFFLKRML